MKQPLITIGLAPLNAEDTAARALQSALAQAWRPLEVVVDDASTDNRIFATLKEIARRHAQLTCEFFVTLGKLISRLCVAK
jgi:glycosyltransferase involved in cell wall biosynthesis